MSKKPTRDDCFYMIGRLQGIAMVLAGDAENPLDTYDAAIRLQSRARVVADIITDANKLIEQLAPKTSKAEQCESG